MENKQNSGGGMGHSGAFLGRTFQYAVECGRPIDVKIMIEEFGADPKQLGAGGESMLELARTPEIKAVLMAAIAEQDAAQSDARRQPKLGEP